MPNGYDHFLEVEYSRSGHFFKALFAAIARADDENLAKLAMSYPEEVDAFKKWTRVVDGVKQVLNLATPGPLVEMARQEYNVAEVKP